MLKAIATLLLLFAAADTARGGEVTCESRDNRRAHCRVPGDGPVRVDFVLSDAPCIENRSWWRTSTGIEVDDGCRAIFSTTAEEPEPPNRNTYIDLVGTDAVTARATLIERGYALIRTRDGDGEQLHYFRTPGRPACLRARERGGTYRDLDGTDAGECR
ncbi:MAG TPA: DUF3011 domain-containing protein [Tahibacter sp.]|uniref:DUF3011 domain-containing protein n=1 Tax=Tahibacter sp. TaxID=2056211 RepID=UPI002CFBD446|nr:DUF3011 domain-containing protein [Tahibacter sp.]HSX59583.1 DUF3011 domain-containing protein [Tahibacter sp.]